MGDLVMILLLWFKEKMGEIGRISACVVQLCIKYEYI